MTTDYVYTSAYLPVLGRNDNDHSVVEAEVRRLAETGASLVTASYTLVEAGALVRSRLGIAAFEALGQTVNRALDVVWVDEELHRQAWRQAATEPRRGASLVDWVGFLVMQNLGIGEALALDQDFRRQGFTLLPKRGT